jgi:hypothetical protein
MAQQPNDAELLAAAPPARGIHEIHAHEHRRYKVIGLDNSQIERTASELVEGSTLLGNQHLWVANFRATVDRIREWCKRHAATIRLALVDVRSNKVLFYFVPESTSYDLDLGNDMTELEVALGGSAGIGYVETLQVPARSLDRFADPRSLQIWSRDE